ncbi:MAG: RagB/SusD family nutrient uptake outer membrane protein [Sphingobacteriales bacterium]|nr:RagB/SusD family nutrient uptake outer membrane protein [Sphingobacteriales bacterium]
MIQQIISDLTQAQGFVPDFHESPSLGTSGLPSLESPVNKGRITKPAVTALLADVYLWNEEYAKAAAEADKILNTDRYRLLGQAGLSIYEGSTRETIFELSHKESIPSPMYSLVLDAKKQFAADNVFINSTVFMPNLKGDVDLRDSRGEGTQYIVGGSITKYGLENPTYYNFQVYRISDVMLIKAEAINELGHGAEALEILNTLREQRGALVATERDVNETDLEGIAGYIIEERARELAFEGKRWFDLLRFAKRNNYSNINVLVELVSKNADDALKQSAINKINDVNSHYLPISETDLFRDPALKQNPFYLKIVGYEKTCLFQSAYFFHYSGISIHDKL